MISRTLIVIFLFSFLHLSAQEKWDLQKCVAYAITNNVSIRQADVQKRLSQITLKQNQATLLPTLSGSVSGSYQRGLNENPTTGTLESTNFLSGSIGVQSGYNIFNWGARKNIIKGAALDVAANEVGIDRARNDVSLLVANAFLQVMLRREQVRISEVQLNQSKEQLRTTRKLVDAGSQPELNAIQIEAQLARDTSALLQAAALVEQSLINLKAYLNLDMATPFDITAPPVESIPTDSITELQPEAVYAQASANQPLQRMYALQIEAANYRVKAARASMYPSLSAFAGLNSRFVNSKFPYLDGLSTNQPTGAYFIDAGGNKVNVLANQPIFSSRSLGLFNQLNRFFGQSVGVSINLPIFNGGNLRAQWERSKVNVTQVQLQDEQERINLKANIYNAYQDAFSSFQKYNASIRNVQASQKALDISKKRYDIGLLGTLDYITTQNNLFTAKIEEVSNHYDYVFKMKVLEFYKGAGIKL